MSRRKKPAPARFGRAPRFDAPPVPAAPFRGAHETDLEQFKARLLREWLANTPAAGALVPLRQAGNEAAAIAWASEYPLLVLPELLREKAEAALRYAARQAALTKPKRPAVGRAA